MARTALGMAAGALGVVSCTSDYSRDGAGRVLATVEAANEVLHEALRKRG